MKTQEIQKKSYLEVTKNQENEMAKCYLQESRTMTAYVNNEDEFAVFNRHGLFISSTADAPEIEALMLNGEKYVIDCYESVPAPDSKSKNIGMENKKIKDALIEVRAILQYFIDEIDVENCSEIDRQSIEYFIKTLDCDCYCDTYVGYNCGCGRRHYIKENALKELKKFNN